MVCKSSQMVCVNLWFRATCNVVIVVIITLWFVRMSRVVYINSIVSILHGVVSKYVSSLNMVNLPYAAGPPGIVVGRYPTNPFQVSCQWCSQCLPKSVTENVRTWDASDGETLGKQEKHERSSCDVYVDTNTCHYSDQIANHSLHPICKCLSLSLRQRAQKLSLSEH